MATPEGPEGLASGGRWLWQQVTEAHELDATQLAQLKDACRQKDRCDLLDIMANEADTPALFVEYVKLANSTANSMKQLLAALRLPDAVTGKRPQYRGPRGALTPSVPGGNVSSIERARSRKLA